MKRLISDCGRERLQFAAAAQRIDRQIIRVAIITAVAIIAAASASASATMIVTAFVIASESALRWAIAQIVVRGHGAHLTRVD